MLRHSAVRSLEVPVFRTFGAAIGALIFIFFMAYMAERLVSPVAASPAGVSYTLR
jgi:flagellar biogenesis protein FliO